MTIFRSSIVASVSIAACACNQVDSSRSERETPGAERAIITAKETNIAKDIAAKCEIPEAAPIIWDHPDIEAIGFGYEPQPITLAPSYGWCPQPENDDNIACAHQVAAAQGIILGRPAMIGDCPRLGVAE